MICQNHTITIETHGKGTYEITSRVRDCLHQVGLNCGLINVFVHHTSCSLVLMENADPSARQDLHEFFDRLVPEKTDYFVHTAEGPDDMPSHIRMALTRSSESIPVHSGSLQLGTWQGIFLFEHRRAPHNRKLTISLIGN